ncbi:MAG: hypothetical protein J6U47_00800 [Bacteroidales bacterium]|nr:hypothetical protein [Bacteroidales bacterium]
MSNAIVVIYPIWVDSHVMALGIKHRMNNPISIRMVNAMSLRMILMISITLFFRLKGSVM